MPSLVEPVPLLLSGCPAGFTPLNLAAIPTYDPTRAIPPPPPNSVAPLNQPTKPAVQKLIRIQAKERERIKRMRAEKEKLLLQQPLFDTPTPTSESLSSKTVTPIPEKERKKIMQPAGPLISGNVEAFPQETLAWLIDRMISLYWFTSRSIDWLIGLSVK